MKAQGIGPSEIAKALKIGRPSVYRVPDPPDAAPGQPWRGAVSAEPAAGTVRVGKRPRPERWQHREPGSALANETERSTDAERSHAIVATSLTTTPFD
jgi:hypothetical protein